MLIWSPVKQNLDRYQSTEHDLIGWETVVVSDTNVISTLTAGINIDAVLPRYLKSPIIELRLNQT
ncbi:hypothetical protein OH492_09125 [Vibrio chagasii]|nr:hypothetical protein [Vibrio chagasii]